MLGFNFYSIIDVETELDQCDSMMIGGMRPDERGNPCRSTIGRPLPHTCIMSIIMQLESLCRLKYALAQGPPGGGVHISDSS